MAGGTLHILLLGLKHIRWDKPPHLLPSPGEQGLVALYAQGEGLAALKAQCSHHLAELASHIVVPDENQLQLPAIDHPPPQYAGVLGKQNSPLFYGDANQLIVIETVDEQGIVAQNPEPFSQLAHIDIYDKLSLHISIIAQISPPSILG